MTTDLVARLRAIADEMERQQQPDENTPIGFFLKRQRATHGSQQPWMELGMSELTWRTAQRRHALQRSNDTQGTAPTPYSDAPHATAQDASEVAHTVWGG